MLCCGMYQSFLQYQWILNPVVIILILTKILISQAFWALVVWNVPRVSSAGNKAGFSCFILPSFYTAHLIQMLFHTREKDTTRVLQVIASFIRSHHFSILTFVFTKWQTFHLTVWQWNLLYYISPRGLRWKKRRI